jgi:hypothetical protein
MKKEYSKSGVRLRDEKYLAWVSFLSCARADKDRQHTKAEPTHGRPWGKSMKSPDFEAVPLCRECHTEEHTKGWISFWGGGDEDVARAVRDYLAYTLNLRYCKMMGITMEQLRGVEKTNDDKE